MKIISLRMILVVMGIALIPLIGIAVAKNILQIAIPDMTRDVTAIANIHPLSGILSSLGILLWWTSATIWLFTAFILRKHRETTNIGFLVYSGLLSAYLGLDDLFQFHEYLAPTYLQLSEKTIYGLLALVVAAYLWLYKQSLLQQDSVLLLLAVTFLSGSVIIDAILEPWLWRLKDWIYFVEDGLKWSGICFWAAFCILRSTNNLKSALQATSEEPASRNLRLFLRQQ